MEQQQVEKRVLASIDSLKSFTALKTSGVHEGTFVQYKEVFQFIEGYVREYGKVPSRELLYEKFSLELPEPGDTEFYVKEFRKNELKRKTHELMEESIQLLVEEDKPEEAIKHLSSGLLKIKRNLGGRVTCALTDGEALQRLDEYLERKQKADKGLSIGIKTGLSFFDEDLGGLESGALLGIVANTSVGKSWGLLYVGCTAYADGNRVLFISPEMTIKQIERRWDVVMAYKYGVELSNLGLIRGMGVNIERYRQFLEAVQERQDWMTADSNEIGSAFTPSTIEDLIIDFKPKVVCVDGLPLIMADGDTKAVQWEKVKGISNALKTMAKAHSVLMVVTNQAVRGAEGKEDIGPGDSGYSYAFVQDCDYAVMLARTKDKREDIRLVRPMKVREGRQSLTPIEIHWAVDRGAIGG